MSGWARSLIAGAHTTVSLRLGADFAPTDQGAFSQSWLHSEERPGAWTSIEMKSYRARF